MSVGTRKRHALRLGVVVLAMFGFGYALVPLYDALCDALGINGRMPLVAAEQLQAVAPDTSRTVRVEFVTTVNGRLPWTFEAEQTFVDVHPGELHTVVFNVTNNGTPAIGQAVPNVAPWNAARHLRKTECFCFNNQPLPGGETQAMPMRFMIDPALPADVNTVTLSYTFFDVPQVASAR
jgi:cytochrome c oxidase assembly protein subunit 11